MTKNIYKLTLTILISLIFITIIFMVLVGENGLINKTIKEYKDTHAEEVKEKEENKVYIEKK